MKVIVRSASVHWTAGAKGGARRVTTERAALMRAPFLPGTSLRNNAGTISADLLAAACAGSFSLTLAQELGRTALSVGDIITSSAVTLERLVVGWTIIAIHLNVVARLPKVTQGRFIDATIRAKTSCLVSRALRATISMNAKLEN